MLMKKDCVEFVSVHRLCRIKTTQGRVSAVSPLHDTHTFRVNFVTKMIEMDPYPIESFLYDIEDNQKIIPSEALQTTVGAAWGDVWKMMEQAIKEWISLQPKAPENAAKN